MNKYLLSAIILCVSFLSVVAQNNAYISGTVKSDQETLVSATVVLLNEQDSSLVNFSLTNNEGYFKINPVPKGEYLLQITYLGYQQYSRDITMIGQAEELNDIYLEPALNTLDEIEIKGEHVPMMMKKDTLEYNADAFKTQPNEVVEDLLKRLPGIEVEDDGTVKAQGEDVQEILVDGKKFFGDDPTMATKNLPADAVEKVQVFDKKSDQAEFSGVDDGERQKTINLDLKEDRKSGAFGTAMAGYGTDDRYKGSLSYNRFASKTQLSLIGNFNNINEQGFSTGDYINFMSAAGWGRGGGAINIFQGLSNGFVTTHAGGLNFNYDPSKKTELSFSYFLNDIENDIDALSATENYADDQNNFFTNATSLQNSSTLNHRFNLRLDQEIDSTQDVRVNASFSLTDGTTRSTTFTEVLNSVMAFQNSSDAEYDSDRQRSNLSLNGTYRKKLGSKSNKTFTLSGSFNDSVNESLAMLDSENLIYQDSSMMNLVDLILQENVNDDKQKDYRISASYVEPIGLNKFLEFEYSRRSYNNDVVSDFFDIVNNENILNTDLSNAFIRDYYYDSYSLGFHINSEKSSLNIEAAVQNSHLKGDVIYDDLLIENDILRVLPRVSWRHEMGKSSNIRFDYRTSVREPSLSQLQPNADNSDPLNIYVGNPDLIPEYHHNMRFNFYSYDQFNFSSFFAYFNASYTKNKITNVRTVDENLIQTTTPVNVDYDFSISGTQEYGTPIKPVDLRINLRNRVSYSNSLTFVNARESKVDRINGTVRLRIENRNKKVLDWNLGGSYTYSISKFTDQESVDLGYNSRTLFADFGYNHKNSFAINTGINVNFFSEEQFGEEQTVPIWTASVSKYFLKDQKGELKISAFDLLDQNLGVSRTQNENYISNQEIISLGRYFMLSFTYSLRGGGLGSKSSVKVSRH